MPRRLLLWGLMTAISLALVAVGVEAAGLVWFATHEGGLFYTARRSEPPPPPRDLRYSVFRPYLGFGIRPGVPIQLFLGGPKGARPYEAGAGSVEPKDVAGVSPGDWTRLRANNFGFYSPLDYPVHEPHSFIVGLFGGSVAHSLAMQGGERLAARLEALPALRGRRVRVLNLAAGGYKEPQQVLALAYFLFLGQRFDYVVNVDGFNEAALGALNVRRGVDSSMPSVAHMAGLELMASDDVGALKRQAAELVARRDALLRERAHARLAATYLWADLRLRRATARWLALSREPLPRQRGNGMLALLPPLPGSEGDAGAQKIAGEWERGSRLLAELAHAHGAGYLHVLQPNQYVSSHRFSPAEARLALVADSPYAPRARRLYPVLKRHGAALARDGIAFVDGSGLFDAVPEAVYADNCCHYNQRGNDLLADLVLREMRKTLEAPAQSLSDRRASPAAAASASP